MITETTNKRKMIDKKTTKEYIAPSIQVIELLQTEILAGSDPYIPIPPDDDPEMEMEDDDDAG